MRRIFLLLLVINSIMTFSQVSDAIVGKWSGDLSFNNTTIPLIFNIKMNDKGMVCHMDSPTQNAFNIPMDEASFLDNRFSTKLNSADISFSGIWSGDVIDGTFVQSNLSFVLVLRRQGDEGVLLQ